MSADMSDSVKQKELIPCPCFSRGFSFNIQGLIHCKNLLYIETKEHFPKTQHIHPTYKNTKKPLPGHREGPLNWCTDTVTNIISSLSLSSSYFPSQPRWAPPPGEDTSGQGGLSLGLFKDL